MLTWLMLPAFAARLGRLTFEGIDRGRAPVLTEYGVVCPAPGVTESFDCAS